MWRSCGPVLDGSAPRRLTESAGSVLLVCITSMISVVDRHPGSQQLQHNSVQAASYRSDQNHRTIRAAPLRRLPNNTIYY